MLLLGLLCLPLRAAIVEKIDDSQINGTVVSVADGKLTIKPIAATPPSTQPTTQESIPFSEISRVTFRRAVAPVTAAAPAEQNAEPPPQQQPRGAIAMIISGLFNGDPNAPMNTGTPPADVVAPAPTHAAPTTRPLATIDWQVSLLGGDHLHGKITEWSEQKFALKIAIITAALEIPTSRITQLWCGEDADVKKARAIGAGDNTQDTAFVLNGADVVAVKGQVLGAEGESLRFRYGDQDRKIALGRVVGIVLASAGQAPPDNSSYQALRLDGLDSVSGAWSGMEGSNLNLKTPWGTSLAIPLSAVSSIDFLNGRLVYLSDLKPVKVEQTPFFGMVIPWRADRSLGGGPIQLAGTEFAKGIAMHTKCALEYELSGFEQLRAKVGFEPGVGQSGQAALRVLGDGKILYENPDARGDQKPVDIELDLRGVSRLRLEADFGKGQDVGGRIVWANARLLRPEVK